MKKTLIALAAAATVSLGAIGAASAAPAASLDMSVKTGVSTQEVGHRFRRGYRYYGHGYRHHRYGYGRFYCKRLYYKGYVLGFGWARYKYVRHCAYRYGY